VPLPCAANALDLEAAIEVPAVPGDASGDLAGEEPALLPGLAGLAYAKGMVEAGFRVERKRADGLSHANLRQPWQSAGSALQRPFAPAPPPSCRAPQSIFRVLGSASEKPAGVLGQERLNG
jgi:hypothetical protein